MVHPKYRDNTLKARSSLFTLLYLVCLRLCFGACQTLLFGRLPQSDSPLLPKKRSLWSIWVLHGVHSATLMVSLFVLIAKLIIIHFYDRNKIIGKFSTRDGQSLFPFMPGLTNEKSHRVVWSKNSFMEISSCKKLTLLKNASSNWKWANSNGTIFYWSNWMYFVFLFFRFSVYDLQFWTFLQGTSGMALCVGKVPCSSPQWRFLISVINLLMK